MSKRSPLEIVQEEHGSKAQLARNVLDRLDEPEDEDEALDLEHRVESMSNRKLLRLHNAQEVLEDEFGSRQQLIDEIVDQKFPAGNDEYAEKLESYSVTRLLDLARQVSLVDQSRLGWRAASSS